MITANELLLRPCTGLYA